MSRWRGRYTALQRLPEAPPTRSDGPPPWYTPRGGPAAPLRSHLPPQVDGDVPMGETPGEVRGHRQREQQGAERMAGLAVYRQHQEQRWLEQRGAQRQREDPLDGMTHEGPAVPQPQGVTGLSPPGRTAPVSQPRGHPTGIPSVPPSARPAHSDWAADPSDLGQPMGPMRPAPLAPIPPGCTEQGQGHPFPGDHESLREQRQNRQGVAATATATSASAAAATEAAGEQ